MRRTVLAGRSERGDDREQRAIHHRQGRGEGDFGVRSPTGAAREGRHDLR